METLLFKLDSIDTTRRFGIAIGKACEPGDIICLDGDLGSGKTTLTQFIAKGLEVPDDEYVTSPSFNIFHQYQGRIPLYHMDFYRLNSSDDVLDMGLDEFFYASGLTVIEWSQKALEILPKEKLLVNYQMDQENRREVSCSTSEERWKLVCKKFVQQSSSS